MSDKNSVFRNQDLDELDQMLIKKFGEAEYLNARNRAKFKHKLANAVKQRRIELKMDQKDLALKLKTSQQQLSRYEVGKNSPTVDRLYDLCIILDMELIIRDRHDGRELIRS